MVGSSGLIESKLIDSSIPPGVVNSEPLELGATSLRIGGADGCGSGEAGASGVGLADFSSWRIGSG